MSSNEAVKCIMGLSLFEELLLFLRDQHPQDAYNYAELEGFSCRLSPSV